MSVQQIKAIYQNFKDPATGADIASYITKLRQLMKAENLDTWLVPHGDEYQNEYLPACAERLAWLTGFNGSAGFCVVTQNQAVIFVDGRYTLQVAEQVDMDVFTIEDLIANPPHKWLGNWLETQPKSARIGFDPWLTTQAAANKLEALTISAEAELVAHENLIDLIWHDQPKAPLEPVTIHDDKYSGELALKKIDRIKKKLADAGAQLCILTDPASIAWLFNIRGKDTPHTPLPLGFAIIRADVYPILFMDKRKMSLEVEAYLSQLADIEAPAKLDDELAKLCGEKSVWVEPTKISAALCTIITENGGSLIKKTDPTIYPRAIKNDTEIKGSRHAHLRDGVALTKFLYWLDQQEPGTISEISAAQMLETMRHTIASKFDSKLEDISFDTISGAGKNGAIVHYRVTQKSNATLQNNSLYLVDSGGQYRDGTTDITRTIVIGTPPQNAIEDFTLVLKGHVAIAMARFPQGTRGVDLDVLARNALWRHGRDYAHGTGHGIGSYLSVHEGPQSISKRAIVPLQPGMILSNEPGFYRAGEYGIRIENLVLVKDAQEMSRGNIAVMNFETLSMAPIDLRLVDAALLNDDERHWLNAYHGWIKSNLSPHLGSDENNWLEKATAPISLDLPAASA